MAASRLRSRPIPSFSPTDFHLFAGEQIPDPITFALSPRWLGRPNLYPRQATLLKIIFLRNDLLTEYDHDVIDEWEESFRNTGNNGITPDIRERMRYLKAQGYPWFREVLLVLGRRAGKGYVAALAMAYVLWTYLAMGDPQGRFGVDRDKQLACFIYAGKKEQARENLWKDLTNVITGGVCFSRYISRPLGESLSVFAPNDFLRMKKLRDRGIISERDMATFLIQPKEATLMSGRGPTSFCLDPETPVLTSDLTWVPIKDLRAGDRVVGVDEHPTTKGAQRKMRDAEVVRVWKTRKTALRLTFDDGTDVVCSSDHKWLFKDFGKGGGYLWRESAKLRPGARIRHLVDPWTEDRSWEAGYLAGVFDGEGCVSGWQGRAGKSVLFTQNRGEVLDATLAMLEDKGFQPQHATNSMKNAEQWSLGGAAESMAFLGSIRPVRLFPKHKGVWEGVALRGGLTPSGRARSDAFKTIVSIEELPEQDLIDIETTTHTFIANGFISHNCQAYDEMAHVIATGANRSAEEVYGAATPALDQFKKYAFIIEPSSPWQQIGQFYKNYEMCLAFDEEGEPEYPQMMMIQLASWEMYYDWQDAHLLDLFPEDFLGDLDEYKNAPHPMLPPLKQAIQEYDEGMRRLEKANPDTFKVERRSHWQATMDAYLNPQKVREIFQPWGDRVLTMQTEGRLSVFYKAHADPSLANANFGFAIAHPETDDQGVIHCVFDYIHHWQPSDFDGNIIHYPTIDDYLWEFIKNFKMDEFTFDQWNSANSIARLNENVRAARFPKNVLVYEKTATAAHNWERAENFKIGINQNWIHAPYYEQAELELKFLQLKAGNKVEKQDAGPVQTKDVADCMMECAWTIIGEQVRAWTHGALSSVPLYAGTMGGFDPYQRQGEDDSPFSGLNGQRGRRDYDRRGGGRNPSRNPLANRNRRR